MGSALLLLPVEPCCIHLLSTVTHKASALVTGLPGETHLRALCLVQVSLQGIPCRFPPLVSSPSGSPSFTCP